MMHLTSPIYDFISKHPTPAYLLSSVIIFGDGYASFNKKKPYWIQWQLLGMCVSGICLGTMLYSWAWPSVIASGIVFCGEALITHRLWSKQCDEESRERKQHMG
jgi:hypothetical protein